MPFIAFLNWLLTALFLFCHVNSNNRNNKLGKSLLGTVALLYHLGKIDEADENTGRHLCRYGSGGGAVCRAGV